MDKMKSWFSAIVTDCFKDHYIAPSTEWTKFPAKALKNEYQLFETKKKQAEKFLREDPNDFLDIHFAYMPDPNRYIEDLSFETESSCLEELGDFPGRKIIRNGKDLRKGMLALRWFLGGHGCHIPSAIQKQFQSIGIFVESAHLGEWNLKHIALQALAQYWIYGSGDFNAARIKERILDADRRIQHLFRIEEWSCVKIFDDSTLPRDRARTFERLIANICNSSRAEENEPERINFLGIFNDTAKFKAINFGKLQAILYYLSMALALDGVSLEAILGHPLIQSYLDRVPYFPGFHPTATGWVKQAVRSVNFFNLKT